ncbi:CASTOR/POLLUX-related putative ion channel [Actinocorallia libanotica]|uniref:Lipoprotein n=1 Tax=Actinocorallia libanotica TaxID=46162 RepID=A0ABP4CE52_9ACTN
MGRPSWRERWRYWFDNTMARGTPALIGWLGLASAVLVLVVATLAELLAPRDSDENGRWPGLVWRSLLRTLDPGTMGDDTGTAPFLGLMLTSTVGGIFIVSALIGVLTNGLNNKIAELRKGRSRIIEQDHTVLLGWSEQVFTVLAELAEANQSRRRSCVVVLADLDKVEMEDLIRARVGDLGRTRVVCRHGNPLKVVDLELVSLDTARSVMVLSPPEEDPDIYVVKVLLSLGNRNWDRPGSRPHIVAAVQDPSNLPAARLAAGPSARVIDADDVAIRLVVQAHRQSGLSTVYTDLLDFKGHEFYLKPEPALAGTTFGEALCAYELGVPVGLRHPNGHVALNPPMDTVLTGEEEVIVLAEDDVLIKLARHRPQILREAIAEPPPPHPEPPPERTLILGWNGRGAQMVTMLDEFVRSGSVADLAARCPDPRGELGPLENLTVGYTRCDPTDREQLDELDVASYQKVIVLADADADPDHADARTLITLLHLRDIEERQGVEYSIVSEIHDDANREIAQVTRADDFVVSERLISLLLTQLSENRHIYEVFHDLLDHRGSEIYLKPAVDYLLPDAPANFATLLEAGRGRGEAVIGYRLHAAFHRAPHYGVVLNPDKTTPLTLGADDLVIVIADAGGGAKPHPDEDLQDRAASAASSS